MWALVKLDVSPDAALVQAMSAVAVSKARDFNVFDISQLLWALATLKVSPDAALVRAMLDNIRINDLNSMRKRQLHTFLTFNSLSAHPVDVSSWADLVAKCKPANE
jgi:aryl carrier-like protein